MHGCRRWRREVGPVALPVKALKAGQESYRLDQIARNREEYFSGRCCVWSVRGMLKSRSGLALDGQRQLVEGDRHPPVHRAVDGKLVVSSAEVLNEGVPGDHNPSAAVLFEPPHRTQP
jgi:hypothetical protein